MTSPPPSPEIEPSNWTWNRAFAVSLLGLSAWTLIADLLHQAHILLQTSSSGLFLALFVWVWISVAVFYAGFPKRFVLGATLISTLRFSFGWPLIYGMDIRSACLWLDALLVGLAILYVRSAMRTPEGPPRPGFCFQHFLSMSAASVVLLLGSLPTNYLGLVEVIKTLSGGYVTLSTQGIDLQERVFAKDGRRVHLVGMAHIADNNFYKTLNRNLTAPVEGRRLVLVEGVSDADNLLPASFASGEIYASFAAKLGLVDQAVGFSAKPRAGGDHATIDEWTEDGVDFRRADIDIRELSPEHRKRLIALLTSLERIDLASLFQLPDDMTASEFEDLVVQGLVKQRNGRLMEVFAASEADYTEIYIPWGAAHLPDLERRITALGYRSVGGSNRRVLDFGSIFRRS
ncbi:MAG: hypothetical protein DVB23_000226 [Verrucomicrobia bacterium]|jgi:hypothetical protein|nr:MAG: hypothetical protein DVB23_000226 [Verrucomicrobiota bacterium]